MPQAGPVHGSGQPPEVAGGVQPGQPVPPLGQHYRADNAHAPAHQAWSPENHHANGDQAPAPLAPMPPPPPFGGGAGASNGRRANGHPGNRPAPARGPIPVQPFAGFGVAAEFDPASGALQAVPASDGSRGGVYGDLGESRVVFYRDGAGLALRVDGRTIDLGGPVRVEWVLLERRTTRFAVIENGVVVFEVRYRTLPPEMDLGALVHSVLADPQRREQTFRA